MKKLYDLKQKYNMRKITLLCLISLNSFSQKGYFYQPTAIYNFAYGPYCLYQLTEGCYNTCIGKGAGFYLTKESYCVIIGSDSIAKNIKGKDMLWYVDYNDPTLNKHPVLRYILKNYNLKKDNKDNRKELNRIIYLYFLNSNYFKP